MSTALLVNVLILLGNIVLLHIRVTRLEDKCKLRNAAPHPVADER